MNYALRQVNSYFLLKAYETLSSVVNKAMSITKWKLGIYTQYY